MVVVPALGTRPATVQAATLGNVFAYDSADEWVGQGGNAVWTDSNASFGVYEASSSSMTLWVGTKDAQNWFLQFAAPAGQTLDKGVYLGAAGSPDPGQPTISVSGAGRGCNTTSGSFAIEDLVTDGNGVPTAAAVSFEQACDGSFGLLVGRIRVGSSLPLAGLSMAHPTGVFPNTRVGDTTAPTTFTVNADGDLPVTLGALAVTGAQSADFALTADGCSGRTLAPGTACSYTLTSTPSGSGVRSATLTIASDLPLSPRQVALRGVGLIPTSTSVSVGPDTTWNDPGLLYAVHVTPNPGGGTFDCFLDGVMLAQGTLGPDGSGICTAPRDLGAHTVQGAYEASDVYAASVSDVVGYTASPVTSTVLSAIPGKAGVVDVTASVSTAYGLLYPGGVLTITDETSATILGTLAIDAADATLSETPVMSLGPHHVVAAYSGVAGVLDPSSTATDLVVDTAPPTVPGPPTAVQAVSGDASAIVSWTTPVSDGGAPILGYAVTSAPEGRTCATTGGTLSCTVSGLTNGTPYTFTVVAANSVGHGPASAASATVTPVAPPPPTAPTTVIAGLPSLLAANAVQVRWSATPGTNPVATYDVRYRRAAWNGSYGGYATWLSATTTTGATFSSLPGSTYCFSVRARDSLGLLSNWTGETCTTVPLDDRSLSRVGSWTAATNSSYYRSTFVRSYSYGARLVRTGVVARQIALLATTCRTCGSVRVYWGSTLLRIVSLYSSTTHYRQFITITTFTSARSGTLTIRVSSSGRPVIIDGVAVRR